MNYYNKFKKIISYINFIFGIYLWALVIYAILRATGLIKRFALQEHLLGEYYQYLLNLF